VLNIQKKMKKIRDFLSEWFDNKLVYIFVNLIGVGLILNYIVFPGWTARNTVLNILSLFVAGMLLIYVGTLLTKNVFGEPKEENKKETDEKNEMD
jgi:hypothetical protein